MTLVIDNYDSFTYNLVQLLGIIGERPRVVRNNEISLEEVDVLNPSWILISPGPYGPEQAGISVDLVRHVAGRIPVLGVCLGHQVIATAFGGKVVHAPSIRHGKTSRIEHDGQGLFEGLPNPFEAMRYHSLTVNSDPFPENLEVSARAEDGTIMGIRHRELAVAGVQFHPESFCTRVGADLMRNFIHCHAMAQEPLP